jgi:hypothetical protein
MEQMARVILSIDSADFNMRYHSSIYDCFVDAGFVVEDTDTNQIDSLNFKVLNQQGFIHGEFPLEIMLPRGSTYIIFDMLGKQIADERKGSVLIQPSELNQGMYVIRISFNSELISIKILR